MPIQKKKLIVIKSENLVCRVQFEGGGQLPFELSGIFTSEKAALKAIELYNSKKESKAKPRTKTSTKKTEEK